MSKERARGPQSYLDERMVLELVPELLRAKGFEQVRVERRGGMKFVVAETAEGGPAMFWLKQGWSTSRLYSAIQFGMIDERTNPRSEPDSVFVDRVASRAAAAKSRGAGHVLMVHMFEGTIRDYVALRIDDLALAYRRQIRRWPRRARNTKIPTLWFEDDRDHPEAASVSAVTALEVPLEEIAGVTAPPWPTAGDEPGSRKITAEVEQRLRQHAFRVRVGERYGWTCPVSGTAVREVLEAAHLPGRDWRVANEAIDGVLLRADLHRLLDRGLAVIRDGRFRVVDRVRAGEYVGYNGAAISPRGERGRS